MPAQQQGALQIRALSPNNFHHLPEGFDYPHSITTHTSGTTAFKTGIDTRDQERCIICGVRSRGGHHPGVKRVHIIPDSEYVLWGNLKNKIGFVPQSAKSVENEPRNGISLCSAHHSDFEGFRFFIRWVPSDCVFVLVNVSSDPPLQQFHGKKVMLDPDHVHSPFPAVFLIHEMRARGNNPWFIDAQIPYPLPYTYNNNSGETSGTAPQHSGGRYGIGWSGGGRGVDISGMGGSNVGGGGAEGGEPTSTGGNQQYLLLTNPFQDGTVFETMRRESQQLPSWKAANVEGLTWEGTAEENAQKYIELVGVDDP